jgi:CHAD domain-containing protein
MAVAFEFRSNETVGEGVKRVVAEQINGALSDLSEVQPRQADTAVHSVRKRFKKVRALIRLVRRGLGEAVYAHENHWFRDTGAALSEVRDAAVLVQTLDTLKPQADADAFELARKRLVARRRAVKRRVLKKGNGFVHACTRIASAGARLASWPLDGADWNVIEAGIRTVYRKGRQAYRVTLTTEHAEMFHEWRKRTKDLWHQTELLEPLWPQALTTLGDEFHALADTLGMEHDLAVLKGVLEAEAIANGEPPSAVLPALEARRAALVVEAHARGARLFAEKPGAFAKRLRHYWDAWRAGEAPIAV